MLSGMIIAQQFNGIGLDLIAGGAIGYVFGPLVMLVGHAFNIAMGVLGAVYSRLQAAIYRILFQVLYGRWQIIYAHRLPCAIYPYPTVNYRR